MLSVLKKGNEKDDSTTTSYVQSDVADHTTSQTDAADYTTSQTDAADHATSQTDDTASQTVGT